MCSIISLATQAHTEATHEKAACKHLQAAFKLF